ncbi:phosphoglycolate phosphatase [Desulfuromusa kysingii]|uniref:phosphoglycolate phosphatase n=1 Tax=Desulfuromusa kysingii TaxID=37625 RepID=A0A1H3WWA7_9BACT|nr:HAD-IA family hydrolase [Desulfuromusa kysingii]SDZ91447.1 phosphoglycolate phosphatase [Desulfuromusa kysingii]
MKTINYLLFDLDGTLVDSVPDLALSLNLLRGELDRPPLTENQVAQMVGDGASVLVKRAIGEEFYQPAHLDRFMQLYDQHLLDNTICYPGIQDLLNHHPANKMGIVTNKPYQLSMKLLEGLKLTRHFKVIIGGDSFAHKKPHSLPVLKALEALSADPQQTVMIGDHHTDIRAGRDAGTATCFCAYGMGNTDGLTTDFYAAQATDLLPLFPGSHLD